MTGRGLCVLLTSVKKNICISVLWRNTCWKIMTSTMMTSSISLPRSRFSLSKGQSRKSKQIRQNRKCHPKIRILSHPPKLLQEVNYVTLISDKLYKNLIHSDSNILKLSEYFIFGFNLVVAQRFDFSRMILINHFCFWVLLLVSLNVTI